MAKNDFYGNFDMSKLLGVATGDLALYVKSQSDLTSSKGKETENNLPDNIIIPAIDDVISCYYFPYLTKADCILWETEYDSARLPLPTAVNSSAIKTINRLRRIKATGQNKVVAEFPKYKITGTTIRGNFNWRNEGKLWMPPFTTIILDDNMMNEPMTISTNYIKDDKTTFQVKVRHTFNHLGIYTMYVPNYLGDPDGLANGNTVSGLRFPTASNNYADYMNANRSQIEQSKRQNFLTGMSGLGMTIGGALTGNAIAAMSGAGLMLNSINQMAMQQARERDLINTGNTLTCDGSDAIHGVQITAGLTCRYMQYDEAVMERIGLYFHTYGYAQNKMMKPNLRSRYYFNFIKTLDANVRGAGIPREHLNKIKNIFNQGTTIWHVDRGSVVVGDYTKDNYEV